MRLIFRSIFSLAIIGMFTIGWATVSVRDEAPETKLSLHDPGFYKVDLSFSDFVLTDRTVVQAALEPAPVAEPDQARMPVTPAVLAAIDTAARIQHYRRLRWDAG